MFPGQGSQEVGMGQDLANASKDIAAIYSEANDIVGYDLAKICFEGPQDELNKTDKSQPAIFVTSVVCLKAIALGLVDNGLKDVTPDYVAGLSLGEYSALYASGVIDFTSALKLVAIRGESMQRAAEARKGTMVSILGIDEATAWDLAKAVLAQNIAEDDGLETILVPVNFNCPGQIVFSGSLKACHAAAALGADFGASRAIPLAVAGAFHTSMMNDAAQRLQGAIATCKFGLFNMPVVANVDAKVYGSTDEIETKLMDQLVNPVRWQQSIEWLLEASVERFVEIGPKRVLTGLLKKTCRAQKKKVDTVTINGLA